MKYQSINLVNCLRNFNLYIRRCQQYSPKQQVRPQQCPENIEHLRADKYQRRTSALYLDQIGKTRLQSDGHKCQRKPEGAQTVQEAAYLPGGFCRNQEGKN